MPKWLITYHTITQESAEAGDYASSGFLSYGGWHHETDADFMALSPEERKKERMAAQFDSLKAALRYVHPASDSGNSFDEVDPDINYRTGEDEYRQLHPPKTITKASYQRVKRVLGVR